MSAHAQGNQRALDQGMDDPLGWSEQDSGQRAVSFGQLELGVSLDPGVRQWFPPDLFGKLSIRQVIRTLYTAELRRFHAVLFAWVAVWVAFGGYERS